VNHTQITVTQQPNGHRRRQLIKLSWVLIQWRGEWYDGTSSRTGPLQSKKFKIELKDNAKKMNKNISYYKGVMLWQFGPPMSALGLQDS